MVTRVAAGVHRLVADPVAGADAQVMRLRQQLGAGLDGGPLRARRRNCTESPSPPCEVNWVVDPFWYCDDDSFIDEYMLLPPTAHSSRHVTFLRPCPHEREEYDIMLSKT